MDLSKVKKAYFIGIKGAGMTAVAEILSARGVEISGSDTREKFFTDEILKRKKIEFYESFSARHVPQNADLIIYSTAYNKENNVELQESQRKNFPMLSYPEILGELFKEKFGIAVCGTHGKTTTTAMLSECLRAAGADPASLVGSKVLQWGGGSLSGSGKFFIAEADEYQNKFQYYNPWAVVLTSVDWDHPDYFPTFEKYKEVFSQFIAKIPRHGFLVVWGDSAATNEVACGAKCEIIKYGFLEDNDVTIMKHETRNMKQNFEIIYGGKNLGQFQIQLIGKHNILNAAAAVATCHKLKIDMEKVREALANFAGTARRFEYIGERNGAILIDDYAHHPEEIKATLKATREIYPGKNIITVFHPHTFTRTKALFQDFAQSFDDTDKVIILDIYGSAREVRGGVTSSELVDLINKYNSGKAEYIPTINEAARYLKDKLGENDIVISMGAGDVWKVAGKLAS
jgi:UDP-N-acetylmuramate--alanine ligase